MKVLILYATTEGQTGKVARFAMDRLVEAGHSVAVISAGEAGGMTPETFDAAILAGSVHAGRYQKELVGYAREHAAALSGVRTLFLSVSLAAAGDDAEDWKQLEQIVARFMADTDWRPDRVEHVAGAFRFTEYDFFKYWAMRWIESNKDRSGTPGQDREYTDWEALACALEDWA